MVEKKLYQILGQAKAILLLVMMFGCYGTTIIPGI
jgi:hypothetical protein